MGHLYWWGRLGSNQRPSGYEPPALTPELRPQDSLYIIAHFLEIFNLQDGYACYISPGFI